MFLSSIVLVLLRTALFAFDFCLGSFFGSVLLSFFLLFYLCFFFFFLMIRRPPRSTQSRSSAASDVYKRQTNAPGLVVGDLVRFVGVAPDYECFVGALREAGLE